MNNYFVSLGVMAAIVAIGLPAAGWLYETQTIGWAIFWDIAVIIIPFLAVSANVIRLSFTVDKKWMLMNVVIVALWIMTFNNLISAFGKLIT